MMRRSNASVLARGAGFAGGQNRAPRSTARNEKERLPAHKFDRMQQVIERAAWRRRARFGITERQEVMLHAAR